MDYNSLRKEKMMALKEKNQLKNKVLTNVLSELIYQKKELGRDPNEEECLGAIRKMVKQSTEAFEMAKSRPDKQEEIQKELDILKAYLPAELAPEVVKEKVEAVFNRLGLEKSMKSKGPLMGACMKEIGSQASGKVISEAVDNILQG